MLPLGLLNAALGHPMLVELKNGETLNGHLASCDTYMNLILKEVVQTSPEGDKFYKMPEVYVRGNNVCEMQQVDQRRSITTKHLVEVVGEEIKPGAITLVEVIEEGPLDVVEEGEAEVDNDSSFKSKSSKLTPISTENLYGYLLSGASQGEVDNVYNIVTHLVNERHEEPNLRHYDALILANIDPINGSAAKAAALWRELKDEGFNAESGTYHKLLKVLAVHPNYLLRNQVFEEMRQHWFSLTPDGWHDVVTGLLRDGQLEMALENLEHMQREDVRIEDWLLDVVIYTLLDLEEIDEALKMIKSRNSLDGAAMSANLWYQLLDRASRASHYEGTIYAWRNRVEKLYLNPPEGVCSNVLNTASRHGDGTLAADVFRILGNRGTRLEPQHYEALADAYMVASDITTAIGIHCIIEDAGMTVEESSTGVMFDRLRKDPDLIQLAFGVLQELRKEGRSIPTATINCVIQSSISQGRIRDAIALYKSLHQLCPAGPNTATFRILLEGCNKIRWKELGTFLFAEMLTLKIKPDEMIYDSLVLLILQQEDYGDAFVYLEDMKKLGYRPRQSTYTALIQKCLSAGDTRASKLLEEREAGGLSTVQIREDLQRSWKKMT
ncbi:MAG: hypothetical protein M1816_007251 [Peltula sp. TS41687]|nr:MAG: hypothetical protein M1816_007251 [Peltula sp. TS41687]